jgi:hypothetical protein
MLFFHRTLHLMEKASRAKRAARFAPKGTKHVSYGLRRAGGNIKRCHSVLWETSMIPKAKAAVCMNGSFLRYRDRIMPVGIVLEFVTF